MQCNYNYSTSTGTVQEQAKKDGTIAIQLKQSKREVCYAACSVHVRLL